MEGGHRPHEGPGSGVIVAGIVAQTVQGRARSIKDHIHTGPGDGVCELIPLVPESGEGGPEALVSHRGGQVPHHLDEVHQTGDGEDERIYKGAPQKDRQLSEDIVARGESLEGVQTHQAKLERDHCGLLHRRGELCPQGEQGGFCQDTEAVHGSIGRLKGGQLLGVDGRENPINVVELLELLVEVAGLADRHNHSHGGSTHRRRQCHHATDGQPHRVHHGGESTGHRARFGDHPTERGGDGRSCGAKLGRLLAGGLHGLFQALHGPAALLRCPCRGLLRALQLALHGADHLLGFFVCDAWQFGELLVKVRHVRLEGQDLRGSTNSHHPPPASVFSSLVIVLAIRRASLRPGLMISSLAT